MHSRQYGTQCRNIGKCAGGRSFLTRPGRLPARLTRRGGQLKKVFITLFLVIASLAVVPSSEALVVAGVDMPDTLMVGGEQLILNGAGIRVKKFLGMIGKNIYVATFT